MPALLRLGFEEGFSQINDGTSGPGAEIDGVSVAADHMLQHSAPMNENDGRRGRSSATTGSSSSRTGLRMSPTLLELGVRRGGRRANATL